MYKSNYFSNIIFKYIPDECCETKTNFVKLSNLNQIGSYKKNFINEDYKEKDWPPLNKRFLKYRIDDREERVNLFSHSDKSDLVIDSVITYKLSNELNRYYKHLIRKSGSCYYSLRPYQLIHPINLIINFHDYANPIFELSIFKLNFLLEFLLKLCEHDENDIKLISDLISNRTQSFNKTVISYDSFRNKYIDTAKSITRNYYTDFLFSEI